MFVAKFIFFGICTFRFLLACVFREGASNLGAFVSGLHLFMFNDVRFINFVMSAC